MTIPTASSATKMSLPITATSAARSLGSILRTCLTKRNIGMRSASCVPNVGRHLSTSNLGPRRTEFIVDPATMLSSPLGAMDAMMSLEQAEENGVQDPTVA